MNILISSAGRRVSLLNAFKETSEKYFQGRHKIFASDANPKLSAACMAADLSFKLPRVNDASFVGQLLKVCVENNISLIIPTIDTELKVLAKNRKVFSEKNITIIVADINFIDFCRDKRKTNLLFEKYNIKVPAIIDKNKPTFPLFIKPYDGSNSVNLTLVRTPKELLKKHIEDDKLVFWEYVDKLNYDEYTIDAYFDINSELVCLVPRLRIEVRGGEINKGMTCNNSIVTYLKERLQKLEGARGCITIQLFKAKNSDDIFGIEVNPRFGGGYPLSYTAGANYPLWIIQEYLYNEKVSFFDNWKDKLLMLRYDDAIFVNNYEH